MRERILEAAARRFAENGYENTGVRDIARDLGISNPSLYHHFPSKADILGELLSAPAAQLRNAIAEAEALSGRERSTRIVEALLSVLEVHGGGARDVFLRGGAVPLAPRAIADAGVPDVRAIILADLPPGQGELAWAIAVGAVQGAVSHLMEVSSTGEEFVAELRRRRPQFTSLVMRLLYEPLGS